MAYTFKYRLSSAPQPTQDGSGCVTHDISALVATDGINFVDVPGRHKTICVPAAELSTALATGTNGQKVTAYKNALAANLDTQPTPVNGWGTAQLTEMLDANAAALLAANNANTFITVTLNQQYPVTFSF